MKGIAVALWYPHPRGKEQKDNNIAVDLNKELKMNISLSDFKSIGSSVRRVYMIEILSFEKTDG